MTIKEVTINNEQILLKKLLYSNSHGNIEIFEGNYLDLPVAIKRYKISGNNPQIYFIAKTEIRNMLQINHPNINRLKNSMEDENYVYLILELCEMKFSEISPMMSENSLKEFIKSILKMLKYMHENNIVHGNISINKLMFNRGMNGELVPKLINLSKANILDRPNNAGSNISHAVDVYSASQVLFYAATQQPFENERPRNLREQLMMQSKVSKHANFLLASMIVPMIADHPGERPPASALLRHIYLQSAEDVLHFINGCKSMLMGGCRTRPRLEQRCDEVTRNDWQNFPRMTDLMDGRHYYSSITDLLRLIRNKTEHPASYIPHPMSDAEGFLQFFTNTFPTLIAWTWHVMYAESHDGQLARFYPDHRYVAQVPIEDILFN